MSVIMKLSVVIVSYNVKYYLEQCLLSLRAAKGGFEREILVVDNASTDGTADYIVPRFPDIRFIQNQTNLGFSKANNIAINQSNGEYVLLLNPDTIVGEDTLLNCIDFLDSHPEAGATGVAMLKDNGGFAWWWIVLVAVVAVAGVVLKSKGSKKGTEAK